MSSPVAAALSPTSGHGRNYPDSVCHKLRWQLVHHDNTSAPSCGISLDQQCPATKLLVPIGRRNESPALTQISNLTAVSSM